VISVENKEPVSGMPDVKGMYDNIIPEKPNVTFWSTTNTPVDGGGNDSGSGNASTSVKTNAKDNSAKVNSNSKGTKNQINDSVKKDTAKTQDTKVEISSKDIKVFKNEIELNSLNIKLQNSSFLNGDKPDQSDHEMLLKLSKIGSELNQ